MYYNEFTKESSTLHPYYFQMWNVDSRESITIRQALADDGWDKYLDPNTNRYQNIFNSFKFISFIYIYYLFSFELLITSFYII